MIYSSLLFIYVFFPFSLLAYYVTPAKYRDVTLLVLSMIFCAMNGVGFLIFMTVYTAMNFAACHLVGKYRKNKGMARSIMILALVLDISAVFVFRSDFFIAYRELLSIPEEFFPVGISFFTLSAAGILADVYTGKTKHNRNFVTFALYIIFFPRLIIGTPLRYSGFRRMLHSQHTGLADIGTGITFFVKGFAKKVIAADSLYALYSASVSVDIGEMPVLTAWLGAVSYLLSFYFTLSGFSDMSAGISRCFGFRIPKNFNYPIFSQNVRCFTARWHIQASQWFRQYIAKPLYSISDIRLYKDIVLIAVGGLIGFWYTFDAGGTICGIIWGIAITAETYFIKDKHLQATGRLYTFIIAVICTVFMAGESSAYSIKYLFAMIGGNRVLADSQSLYLLKSYVLILIVSIYTAASFFRNIIVRSRMKKVQNIITALSPVIVISMMILCTVLISYRGSSEILLLKM
ncbi:MAG: hypothetical protein IKK47_08135 [Ruminococcus sp.]|nr:hypothetical protein [Ruminococcus sp.]